MKLDFRDYDPARDREAVLRIMREVGWILPDSEEQERAHDLWLRGGHVVIAELAGSAESAVINFDGDLRYVEEDLPLSVVGGVVTSRVARQQRFATSLTAEALARDVIERDAAVAILGMFEQGFYDRIGFGTGSPTPFVAFDPASLEVDAPRHVPIRLTLDDHTRVHAGRIARLRGHGACRVLHPDSNQADMLIRKQGFGLGFVDPETDELTHHLWCSTDSPAHGPYDVGWLAYRDRAQFLELMGLLKGLGDQVNLVRMPEPPGVQLQDLIAKPFHRERVSKDSGFASRNLARAWWQVRICDLAACLEKTRLPTVESTTFHLSLTDPIADHLSASTQSRWDGVAGDYVVTLGPESHAERVETPAAGLPSMTTSVNTFTRLWLGVCPATGLAFTSPDLDAPHELLERLDRTVLVRAPNPDWDF